MGAESWFIVIFMMLWWKADAFLMGASVSPSVNFSPHVGTYVEAGTALTTIVRFQGIV